MRGEHVERRGERIMTTTTSVRKLMSLLLSDRMFLWKKQSERQVYIFIIILRQK